MAASCVDAGLSLTHDIEQALNRGHTASLLTVDVKGFFDNINHQQLLYTLHSMGFPAPIIQWTESFLSERQCSLRVDSFLSPPRPLNTGVPQGSPVSPILSVIYSSPALTALATNPSISPLLMYPTTVRSYIDDFSFLAIGANTTDTTDALRISIQDIVTELAAIGMTIDPSKSELIHFSRRQDPHLLRPLVLPDGSINASPVVRWLGIFFDQKLSFHHHLRILCNRARTAATGLRVLSNTVRGLSQKHLRALHKTCILPIITYASPLWFHPDRPLQAHLHKLDTVQNMTLRLICGTFKTTPVKGLQVIAHQPPIREVLSKFSSNAARRLSRIPTSSPVFQRLPADWKKASHQSHTPIPPLASLPHNDATKRYLSSLEQLSSGNHPKGERMFQFSSLNAPYAPRLSEHPRVSLDIDAIPSSNEDGRLNLIRDINNRYDQVRDSRSPQGVGFHIYFCDGSQRDGRTGAGVHHIRAASEVYSQFEYANHRGDAHPDQRTTNIKVGGGKRATSYDAEMLALAIASKHIRSYQGSRTEINIFSDSSSALKNIIDPGPHPGQSLSLIFISNIFAALDADPDLKITLDWCPGHAKVWGNEEADKLANDARPLRGVFRHSPTSTHLKTKQQRRSMRRWKRSLNAVSPGSSFVHRIPISASPSDTFKDTPKELFGRLTQTLSGHGYTGEYYLRMRIPNTSPWCPCSTPTSPVLQTRRHILLQCPRYDPFRHLLHKDILEEDFNIDWLGSPDYTKSLLHFMHKSGAFTRSGSPFSLNLYLPPAMRDRMRIPNFGPDPPSTVPYQPP